MTNIKDYIAFTLIDILHKLVLQTCCMNCEYYYVDNILNRNSYCIIDKQEIHPNISHIVKCKAFELWFGSM